MTKTNSEMQTQAAARPLRRSDVTVQELDGEALVYDPATADTHRLNETAYFIWRACDGQSTAEGVAERLAETFDVERNAATQHTCRMIEELVERGLVCSDPLMGD